MPAVNPSVTAYAVPAPFGKGAFFLFAKMAHPYLGVPFFIPVLCLWPGTICSGPGALWRPWPGPRCCRRCLPPPGLPRGANPDCTAGPAEPGGGTGRGTAFPAAPAASAPGPDSPSSLGGADKETLNKLSAAGKLIFFAIHAE